MLLFPLPKRRYPQSEIPNWWNSYNKVKHERNLHFDKANLENVLWSGAGLLVMLVYFCAEAVQNRQLNIEFRIFQIPQNMQNLILNGYFLSQTQAAGFPV
jgi:hypothetical protein